MAKIALFCLDVVGKSMAGPAIRYWEFAKALSKQHEVVLLTPNCCDIKPEGFQVLQSRSIPSDADVVITQEITHWIALKAKRYHFKIILDAYDPLPLECLEIFRSSDMAIRKHKQHQVVNLFNFSFQFADAVICANEKQRDLWMGLMMSQKKISPLHYDQDVTLHNLIDLVPFGLSSERPKRNGESLRQRFGLKDSDIVLLWGGGIWNWFDPLTLIEAVGLISESRSDIKLVFMGVKHPNDSVPEMKMASDAVKLAKKLGLLDTHVFFNFGWTPYETRQNFLLDADIGVSTHFEHLETQYAFRTRMLDYLWANLPIIATKGDSFADLIEKEALGIIVPSQDPAALKKAILKLADDSILRESIKGNLTKAALKFHWDEVVKPIHSLVANLAQQKKSRLTLTQIKNIFTYYVKNKSPLVLIKKAMLRLAFTTRT